MSRGWGWGRGQGAVPGNQAELLHTHFSLHFFFKDFFSCGLFLKSLLNLLQFCFCFMFCFFGCKTCRILAPQIEPSLPALEGEVLAT